MTGLPGRFTVVTRVATECTSMLKVADLVELLAAGKRHGMTDDSEVRIEHGDTGTEYHSLVVEVAVESVRS